MGYVLVHDVYKIGKICAAVFRESLGFLLCGDVGGEEEAACWSSPNTLLSL